jgi:hypothetical protein
MTDRAQYIAGLRILADRLEAGQDIPLPYHGDDAPVSWYVLASRDKAAAVTRGLPCTWRKEIRDAAEPADAYLDLTGTLGGPSGLRVKVTVTVNRDDARAEIDSYLGSDQ